jgi:quercetin dioxygenase-like cupin family protein
MNKRRWVLLLVGILSLSSILGAEAATAAIKPGQGIVLQKIDVPKTHYEMGMELAEFPPNTVKNAHMHSGVTLVYVLQGEIILKMQRQVKTFKAGQSFAYPAYVVHEAKSSPEGAKVLASWVGEKGKPIALPAPQSK